MKFTVQMASGAKQDIADIHGFILEREGALLAGKIFDALEKTVQSLSDLPRRGHPPPELAGLGFKDILEIHVDVYRVIYQVAAREVSVLVVADGRRDLKDLLSKRILS